MSSRANSGQQQQFISPNEMYKKLVQLVANETNNDELLVYDKQVLDYMSKQCDHLHTQLANASGRFEQFAIESHKLELQRITYLIHKYLERRLRKIETHASQLINLIKANQDEEITLMSVDEINYLKRYVQGIDVYVNEVLLQQMPPNMQSFNLADIEQDKDSEHFDYKFVRVLNPTNVIVDGCDAGEEEIALDKNSQHFLPYSALKAQLLTNNNLLLM